MRYLDTRTLQQLDRYAELDVGPGRARQRGYVKLAYVVQPHLRPHAGKFGLRVSIAWPMILLHGRAAA